MLHAARVRGAPLSTARAPFSLMPPLGLPLPLHLKSPRDSKTSTNYEYNNNNGTPGRAIRVQRLQFNGEYAYTEKNIIHTHKNMQIIR